MLQELGRMSTAGATDLLMRDAMDIPFFTSEADFLDTVCEVASEHVDPPADKAVDSFPLLVGAIIANYVALKTQQRLHDEGECPCRS
jgi:hypothetical protein